MNNQTGNLISAPTRMADRSYNSILEEAVNRIPVYCPEWKNPVPGDPGLALIELFAWMTEATLFRMDRIVPDATRALLETLGAVRRPPDAALTTVKFTHSGIHGRVRVPAETRVSTNPAETGDNKTFETAAEIEVRNVRIALVATTCESGIRCQEPDDDGFLPANFGSCVPISESRTRLLVGIVDPSVVAALKSCHKGTLAVTVSVAAPANSTDLRWFWFDGLNWNQFESTQHPDTPFRWNLKLPGLSISPFSPDDSKPTGIYLAAMPQDCDYPEISLNHIEFTLSCEDSCLKPQSLIFSDPTGRSRATHEPSDFLPFGPEPLSGTEFLMALPTETIITGTRVSTSFVMKQNETGASDDLCVAWSISKGDNQWIPLGTSTPQSSVGQSFQDSSCGLTRTGDLSFVMPTGAAAATYLDQNAIFLRGYICSGDFGRAGAWELNNDKWSFRDTSPLKPPVLSDIQIVFKSPATRFPEVASECDGKMSVFNQGPEPFRPFRLDEDNIPSVLLGLAGDTGSGKATIFVETDVRQDGSGENRSIWQAMSNGRWTPLMVDDSTVGLTQSGSITMTIPDGLEPTRMFGRRLVWIRCLTSEGVRRATIKAIHTNTVTACNTTTLHDKILGSSSGLPGITLPIAPDILSGERLVVLESARNNSGTCEWKQIEWKAVDTLAWSGPLDRHYERIPGTGLVRFGDGTNGAVPPFGRNNISLASYRTGGGSSGNIQAFRLVTLTKQIPGIAAVTNPVPAIGGYDGDNNDDLLRRAPVILKKLSGHLTCADIEVAAREISRDIHRTRCIETCDGTVRTVIVPRSAGPRPMPDNALIRVVKTELDKIRPVTARLIVTGPRYYPVEITIYAESDHSGTRADQRLESDISAAVRRYLSPIDGADGNGWPFGEPVTQAPVAKLISAMPGIGSVRSVIVETSSDALDPAGLPDLKEITVHID